MKISRFASVVVILLSIGSLWCVHMLRQGRDQLRTEKAQLTGDLAAAKEQTAKTEAKLQEVLAVVPVVSNTLLKTQGKLDNTEKTLKATTAERDKLKASLAEAEKKLEPLAAELASAKEALQKAEETIAKQAAEIATIAGFKERIAALTAENKTLGAKIETLLANVKRLEGENELLRKTPVNTRGRVAAVENRWNFVVLDIGHDKQVRKDDLFLVYRDKQFVCKAQVVSVSENTSVAEVLPEWRHADPRVGDLVVH